MRSKVVLHLFLFLLLGCGHPSVEQIPPEKMAKIMADMTFADQVLNIYEPEDRDSIRVLLTESLLRIHDISQSELDTNLYLYMSDFDKFGPLTDRMLQRYDTLANKYEN